MRRVRALPIILSCALVSSMSHAQSGTAYLGGPVIQNPTIVLVYWASTIETDWPTFFSTVANSSYMDLLSEYGYGPGPTWDAGRPMADIGRGSVLGTFQDNHTKTGSVSDSAIRTRLAYLMAEGWLPQPTANTVYAVMFPPTWSIVNDNNQLLCANTTPTYCGYHSHFYEYQSSGPIVNYLVVPECYQYCKADADSGQNSITMVASHELAEITTDPDIGAGAADAGAPPDRLGWVPEIGDLCAGKEAFVDGGLNGVWAVQKVWSNAQNQCTASGPAQLRKGNALLQTVVQAAMQ
jgi:hypothetical protein